MSTILKTTGLTKRYGSLTAVNELNLSIEEGQVFGLLGPNGSGKTTTLGMILGVTSITSGSYDWFNGEKGHLTRQKIGAILEQPIFYPGYTAVENMKIVAAIKQIDLSNMENVLRMVDLWGRRNDKFSGFSLGMKQRLAIASAMLCDPKALILDEPTNGLDPEGIAQIREIIVNIAKTGKSIILASHLLDEVQKVCTDFCILRKGNLIHTGKVSPDMGAERRVAVNAVNQEQLQQVLSSWEKSVHVEKGPETLIATLQPQTETAELSQHLQANNVVITHLEVLKKSLEEQFLEIVKNS